MKKLQGRFRDESLRAQWWDYQSIGAYFITICTKDKVPFFGKIQNGIMCLNYTGTILYNEWEHTPQIRSDMNITLGDFIVMPDHFHAIIVIGKNQFNCKKPFQNSNKFLLHDMDRIHPWHGDTFQGVPTGKNHFGPQRKNLASIIRGVKGTVTKQARLIDPNFGWQSRFHDIIIKDWNTFKRISKYIRDNPLKYKSN